MPSTSKDTETASVESLLSPPVYKTAKKAKRPMNLEVIKKLGKVMDRFDNMEKKLEQQKRTNRSEISLFSQPSAHSSQKQRSRRFSNSDRVEQTGTKKSLPSMEDLRIDRTDHYEEFSRGETQGMSHKLKSGCYRLGDQRVKNVIHWPHEYCSVGDNFKMPTYEELNVFQWVQGFARCILEEKDPQV